MRLHRTPAPAVPPPGRIRRPAAPDAVVAAGPANVDAPPHWPAPHARTLRPATRPPRHTAGSPASPGPAATAHLHGRSRCSFPAGPATPRPRRPPRAAGRRRTAARTGR
ncbi:hypothetical protein G6F24_016969 [Rhizopus arrhizus]|nr:hypothetical protein G6F24_016969 [Rhizopus arrhizus]